jgi:hypothetical protein
MNVKLLIASCITAALVVTGCEKNNPSSVESAPKFIGTWIGKDKLGDFETEMKLTFNKDRTMKFLGVLNSTTIDSSIGNWAVADTEVYLTFTKCFARDPFGIGAKLVETECKIDLDRLPTKKCNGVTWVLDEESGLILKKQ